MDKAICISIKDDNHLKYYAEILNMKCLQDVTVEITFTNNSVYEFSAGKDGEALIRIKEIQ